MKRIEYLQTRTKAARKKVNGNIRPFVAEKLKDFWAHVDGLSEEAVSQGFSILELNPDKEEKKVRDMWWTAVEHLEAILNTQGFTVTRQAEAIGGFVVLEVRWL